MTFNSRRDVKFRRVRKVIRTLWPVLPSRSVKIGGGRGSRPRRPLAQGTELVRRASAFGSPSPQQPVQQRRRCNRLVLNGLPRSVNRKVQGESHGGTAISVGDARR